MIERTEDVYNDQWLLIFEAVKRFKINQQKTPIFLMGRSFGGLIATNMSHGIIAESLFSGVCLLTPYYRLWTEKLYNLQPVLKLATYLAPHLHIMPEFRKLKPEDEEKWGHLYHDPNNNHEFTPTTAVLWATEQERAKDSLKQTSLPILLIEATEDQVVKNDYMQQFFELANCKSQSTRYVKSRIANKYVKVQNADHTTICFDKQAV